MASHLSTIETTYDQRAANYDKEQNFHPLQHADYIKWMSLTPGLKVLDLACGTGGITIPAKKAVGPTGKVVGVDISSASLAIAREKGLEEGLDITFIHHDIGNLTGVNGIAEGEFDVITCAAAFVLLEDPEAAVKNWAKLLKVGGRVIIDVLTKDTMVTGYVIDTVAKTMRIPLVYDRTRFDSMEKVQTLLSDAGLDPSNTFLCDSYKENEIQGNKAGEIFDDLVDKGGWAKAIYAGFEDPVVRAAAKELFCEKLKSIEVADGKVREQTQFFIGIGKKL